MKIPQIILLPNLNKYLKTVKVGAKFLLKGHTDEFEFYDENKDYFFVRDSLKKQEILIKKM